MTTLEMTAAPEPAKPSKPARKPGISRYKLKDTLRQHDGFAAPSIAELGISEGYYYSLLKFYGLTVYARHLRGSRIQADKVQSAKPGKPAQAPRPAAPMRDAITAECDNIKRILLEKNAAYGNSATDPVRIFSRADSVEGLKVRIDDKLSRLMRGQDAGEDVELDLIGYLVLLRIARNARA